VSGLANSLVLDLQPKHPASKRISNHRRLHNSPCFFSGRTWHPRESRRDKTELKRQVDTTERSDSTSYPTPGVGKGRREHRTTSNRPLTPTASLIHGYPQEHLPYHIAPVIDHLRRRNIAPVIDRLKSPNSFLAPCVSDLPVARPSRPFPIVFFI
jgi:hypothetical protein